METSLFNQLIGSWTLVDLIEVPIDGGEITNPMGYEPKGLIIYNPDGFMSAQIMNPERENFIKEGATYLAYSGPFKVDEAKMTLSHTMYVSLFPNWTGQTQSRIVRFEDGLLHLESGESFISNGMEVIHKLTWKRAGQSSVKYDQGS